MRYRAPPDPGGRRISDGLAGRTARAGTVPLSLPQDKRNDAAIAAAKDKFLAELPHWKRAVTAAGKDFLLGAVGAADFTVYPFFALALRTQKRHPSLRLDAAVGPQLTAWMRRVEALP